MAIDPIDNESRSHLAQFDEDPVLAQVQGSLSSSGSNFGSFVIPPDQSGAQGQQIMNQLAGLTVSGQSQGGPTTATGGSPSTAPQWILAGAGMLATVAGGIAAASGGGGGAAAASGAATTPPPAPAKPAAPVSTATVSGNPPAPASAPVAAAGTPPPVTTASSTTYAPDFGQTLELSGTGSGGGRENLVQWSR